MTTGLKLKLQMGMDDVMPHSGIGPSTLRVWGQAGLQPTFQMFMPPTKFLSGKESKVTIAGTNPYTII